MRTSRAPTLFDDAEDNRPLDRDSLGTVVTMISSPRRYPLYSAVNISHSILGRPRSIDVQAVLTCQRVSELCTV